MIENWIISSFYTPNRAHLSTYQLAPSSIHATHFSTLTGSCHVTKIKPTPTKTPTKGHSRAETTDFHEKNIFLRRPPRWWSRVFRFFCWWRWRMSWWMAADWRSSKWSDGIAFRIVCRRYRWFQIFRVFVCYESSSRLRTVWVG